MMSGAKDRQAKQRAKIKENSDLYKANLEKDRKRKSLELAHAKAKMSNDEREEFLLKERMRMRLRNLHSTMLLVTQAILCHTNLPNHWEKP